MPRHDLTNAVRDVMSICERVEAGLLTASQLPGCVLPRVDGLSGTTGGWKDGAMATNMAGAAMWDQRYSTADYVFGTEPAAFLTAHVGQLDRGSNALVVADGEGRNSVFLAAHGLSVTAMDVSEVGVDKARRLAADRGIAVDFRVADLLEWEWEPHVYDVVVAVFIQFLNPQQRAVVFEGMQRTLRPGGRLLLHGYRPEQIAYGTGGPGDPAHLYDESLLADAFASMDIDVLRSYDAELSEGAGHSGMSALIDLVAVKPAPAGGR